MSGCETTGEEQSWDEESWEERTMNKFCPALKEWVKAGPRKSTGDRLLTLPTASNYIDRDEVYMTSFAYSYGCPDGASCADNADKKFLDVLIAKAHSTTAETYFVLLEGCMNDIVPDRLFDIGDEHDRSINKKYGAGAVTLTWQSEIETAEIVVSYD